MKSVVWFKSIFGLKAIFPNVKGGENESLEARLKESKEIIDRYLDFLDQHPNHCEEDIPDSIERIKNALLFDAVIHKRLHNNPEYLDSALLLLIGLAQTPSRAKQKAWDYTLSTMKNGNSNELVDRVNGLGPTGITNPDRAARFKSEFSKALAS